MKTQMAIFEGPKIELFGDYDSVIVNFSTGIDSTGTLYWALQNFPREKLWLLYCDTGMEYDINDQIHRDVAEFLKIKPVLLRHPKGFLGILEDRGKWPDSSNRWCTAYLKRDITSKWIRRNRLMLGEKCLFLTGERRDESPRRAKLVETDIHPTTLKTERKGKFTCHWHRPVLDYDKGKMFEWGKILGIPAHPCYEHLPRCSCFACVLMPDRYAAINMQLYPKKFYPLLQAEMKHQHTWKQKTSLVALWTEVCEELPPDLMI